MLKLEMKRKISRNAGLNNNTNFKNVCVFGLDLCGSIQGKFAASVNKIIGFQVP
jgi:hypothetical protein